MSSILSRHSFNSQITTKVSLVSNILTNLTRVGNCQSSRLHRATWMLTELFLTFPPPKIKSISLQPQNSDETAGRFRVWLYTPQEPPILLWDRKVEGGFPELKVLVSIILSRREWNHNIPCVRNNVFETLFNQGYRSVILTGKLCKQSKL